MKNPRDLLRSVEQQQEELSALRKQVEQLENKLNGYLKIEMQVKAETVGGFHFIGAITSIGSGDSLKKLCNELRTTHERAVVVLAANIGGKPSVAVGLADSLVTEKGMDAVSIVKKHIAVHIKGGGGGQKTLATAGGQEVSGMEKAIQEIRSILI